MRDEPPVAGTEVNRDAGERPRVDSELSEPGVQERTTVDDAHTAILRNVAMRGLAGRRSIRPCEGVS